MRFSLGLKESLIEAVVLRAGIEPARLAAGDFKSLRFNAANT